MSRVEQVWRWIASRSARWYLFAGWILFILNCYPGYLSVDSSLQLYQVRSGEYSDAFPPVMTFVWSCCELVLAGPFPMVLLQSGLFLFGTWALLSKVISSRAAAFTAIGVLMFPPIYQTMAVVWPDPLVVGFVLGGTGALLQPSKRWQAAGLIAFVVAIGVRPEITFALVPLIMIALPPAGRWKRLGVAIAIVVAAFWLAKLADWALTDTKTWERQQKLELTDIVSSARRVKASVKAFDGLAVVEPKTIGDRLSKTRDALDWYPLTHGDRRVFDLVSTDEGARALASAWRRTVTKYPLAYLKHRELVTKLLLTLTGSNHVMDTFGDPELLAPMHHRASPSGFQMPMRKIVRAVAATPLLMPIIYVALAIGLLVLERKQRTVLSGVAASGLVYLLALAFRAPGVEYRMALWLVASGFIVAVAWIVAKRHSTR